MSKRKKTDWKSISDDKEKYAAYLCSREWAVIREQVRERAGGKCERCGYMPMDACHHLNYQRKYREELDDLQAICTPCHEFTHGKSHFDPTGSVHARLVEWFAWQWNASSHGGLLDDERVETTAYLMANFPQTLARDINMRIGFSLWLANEDASAAGDSARQAMVIGCSEEYPEIPLDEFLEMRSLCPPPDESHLPHIVTFWIRWFRHQVPGVLMDRRSIIDCLSCAKRLCHQ